MAQSVLDAAQKLLARAGEMQGLNALAERKQADAIAVLDQSNRETDAGRALVLAAGADALLADSAVLLNGVEDLVAKTAMEIRADPVLARALGRTLCTSFVAPPLQVYDAVPSEGRLRLRAQRQNLLGRFFLATLQPGERRQVRVADEPLDAKAPWFEVRNMEVETVLLHIVDAASRALLVTLAAAPGALVTLGAEGTP